MVTDTGDTRPFPSHGPSGRLPKLTPENTIRRRIREQSTFPAGTRDDYLARLDEQLKFRLRRDSKGVQEKLEPEARAYSVIPAVCGDTAGHDKKMRIDKEEDGYLVQRNRHYGFHLYR